MRAWEYLLHPELRQLAPAQQAGALTAAADTGFDAIECLGLADAALILMVSRMRVFDVVNQKTAKFTIDTLVEMLSRSLIRPLQTDT